MKYKPPSFTEGDCLAFPLDSGDYAAVLVVADKASHCSNEFGCCLVAVLNYKETRVPTIEDFEKRDVLVLTHSNWKGEPVIRWMAPLTNRAMKKQVIVAGKIDTAERMKPFDISTIKAHGFWGNLFVNLELQKQYDARSSSG